MLFAGNALASGPPACFFAEKPVAKVGKEDHELTRRLRLDYKDKGF
jgi:hypothetical protein